MNNLDALMTSARTGDLSKDEWRTPRWLFNLLDREFDFDLDAAATAANALCKRYYTAEDDGLKQSYFGSTFINPPYSQLRQWVAKGYHEAKIGNAHVVMLVAARTDTRAWWNYIRFGEVRFLKGRLKFEGGKHSAPFPSAVVIFPKFLGTPKTVYWDVEGG